MKNKLIKIWRVLSKKRKKQLSYNLLLMIASGLSEMICLALLTPLLSYLVSGGNKEFELIVIPNYFVINDFRVLIFLVIFSFISAGLIRTFNLFVNTRMAALIGHDLANKSYRNTLNRDYLWHKYNNSSQVIAVISTHTNVTSQVVANTLQMTTSFLVLICLIGTLLIVEWKYGNITILSFSAIYYFLIFKSKRKLLTNSYEIAKSTNLHIKNIKETISSIKDVILYNSEKIFSYKFEEIDLNMRKYIGLNQFIAGYPRFAIEALGITIFALIALVNISLGEDNYRVFTGIALVAIAAQKILPSMQQIYAAWAFIKANTGAVDEVLSFCGDINNKTYAHSKEKKKKVFENLEVNLIKFNYPNTKKSILKNLNFKINKAEFIGIIGQSGKGKSTLLDIILCLLTLEKGEIKVNGDLINGKNNVLLKKSWQSMIAHVPQNPILFDGSIEENINFGSDNELDMKKLIESSKLSNIYDLIKNLPQGFKTRIGENGSSLSGGQKQRIAIARALYKESQVLILDEPTSSLDYETGEEIIKTLINLKEKNFTIIIVTHNQNDIAHCDKIISLK